MSVWDDVRVSIEIGYMLCIVQRVSVEVGCLDVCIDGMEICLNTSLP